MRSDGTSRSRPTTCAPRSSAPKQWRPPPQPASSSQSSRAQPEPIEIDGEHARPRRARRPCARRPRASEKTRCTRRRAARPISATRSCGRLHSSVMAAASASADRGTAPRGRSRRVVPTTSGSAPPTVAITGRPQAIASEAGKPKPSKNDGTSAMRAVEYCSTSSSTVSIRSHQHDALLEPELAQLARHEAVRRECARRRSSASRARASARARRAGRACPSSGPRCGRRRSGRSPSRAVERAEDLGVGAVVDDRDVLLGHAEEALDLARGGVRHREDRARAAAPRTPA